MGTILLFFWSDFLKDFGIFFGLVWDFFGTLTF